MLDHASRAASWTQSSPPPVVMVGTPTSSSVGPGTCSELRLRPGPDRAPDPGLPPVEQEPDRHQRHRVLTGTLPELPAARPRRRLLLLPGRGGPGAREAPRRRLTQRIPRTFGPTGPRTSRSSRRCKGGGRRRPHDALREAMTAERGTGGREVLFGEQRWRTATASSRPATTTSARSSTVTSAGSRPSPPTAPARCASIVTWSTRRARWRICARPSR